MNTNIGKSEIQGNIRTHKSLNRWERVFLLLFGLLLALSALVIMNTSNDPDYKSILSVILGTAFCTILSKAAPLWVILLYIALTYCPFHAIKAIHEGMHVIAAHWEGVPSEQISAGPTNVWVETVPRNTWFKIMLYPLLVPLVIFLLVLPISWAWAVFLAGLFLTGSITDLAYAVLVWRTPGDYVTVIEGAIYVTETRRPNQSDS